jgi:hypothetical protein
MNTNIALKRLRTWVGSSIRYGDRFPWRLIPFRKRLGDLIVPAEIRKELEEFGPAIAESVRRYESHIAALRPMNLNCALWLDGARVNELPTGMFMAMDAIENMMFILGSYARVANVFDRYVFDATTFAANMQFFFKLPFVLYREGYLDLQVGRWKDHVTKDDQNILTIVIANEWTRELTRAKPGHWDYDVLLDELKAF